MTKELKKCYDLLDLDFTATKEIVEARRDALIKICQSKAFSTSVSQDEDIGKINHSADEIISYIEQYGVPNFSKYKFVTTTNDLKNLFVALCAVTSLAILTFFSLL